EGGDLPPAGAVAELGGGDGPEGVAGADGVRAAVAAARPGRRVLEALGDAAADAPHGHAARVDLPGLPFGVADHAGVAVLAPAVRPEYGGRRADHGLHLHVRPRVLAVAEVLALEAVEVPVAVGVRLVVDGQRAFGDDRPEHVVVAQARVVGAAVADQVHAAVLGDDAVAQRPGQTRVALAADVHCAGTALGHRVVNHHPVHRPPRALRVAVVVAPVADLHDRQALSLQGLEEAARGQGLCHGSSRHDGAPGPVDPGA